MRTASTNILRCSRGSLASAVSNPAVVWHLTRLAHCRGLPGARGTRRRRRTVRRRPPASRPPAEVSRRMTSPVRCSANRSPASLVPAHGSMAWHRCAGRRGAVWQLCADVLSRDGDEGHRCYHGFRAAGAVPMVSDAAVGGARGVAVERVRGAGVVLLAGNAGVLAWPRTGRRWWASGSDSQGYRCP